MEREREQASTIAEDDEKIADAAAILFRGSPPRPAPLLPHSSEKEGDATAANGAAVTAVGEFCWETRHGALLRKKGDAERKSLMRSQMCDRMRVAITAQLVLCPR